MPRNYSPCPEATAQFTFLDERLLIARAQVGDIWAMDDLELTHHPCIHRVACAFHCLQLETEVCHQEGCYAFRAKAVPHYRLDEETREKEIRLWSYAYNWVWSAMRDACAQWHGLSSDATRYFGRVLDTARTLSQSLDHEPTVPEIAAAAKLKPSVVQEVLSSGRREIPLDPTPADEEEEERPQRQLTDPSPPHHTRAFGRDLYDEVITVLGPSDGVKWLILFLLKEAGYAWNTVSAFLRGDPAAAAAWPVACTDKPLPDRVPTAWEGVLACFQQAPQESGANTLCTWYNEKRKILAQKLRP